VALFRRFLPASIILSLVCLAQAACTGSTPSQFYPAPILTMETETLPLPSDLAVNRDETLEPLVSQTASPTFFLTPNPNNTLVGAIRWDAWVGNYVATGDHNQPGLVVERTLSPNHWHYRLPFFAVVLDGRPLVYVFGNKGLTKEGVQSLREDTIAAGLPTPYIVFMGWSSAEGRANMALYGLDAGSAYATLGNNGQPFLRMAKYGQILWDQYRKAGIQVVPWVTTGWDPRPRVENPTPWVTYPENQWAQTARPEEIAMHLQEALAWIEANPEAAPANAVIMYAWNEFDEGGWLCPTLSEGTARLDAIRIILVGE
jgi:hypothetical protein